MYVKETGFFIISFNTDTKVCRKIKLRLQLPVMSAGHLSPARHGSTLLVS